jgi:hypothetical protein
MEEKKRKKKGKDKKKASLMKHITSQFFKENLEQKSYHMGLDR